MLRVSGRNVHKDTHAQHPVAFVVAGRLAQLDTAHSVSYTRRIQPLLANPQQSPCSPTLNMPVLLPYRCFAEHAALKRHNTMCRGRKALPGLQPCAVLQNVQHLKDTTACRGDKSSTWTATRCSYMARIWPVVKAFSSGSRMLRDGRLPVKVL